VFLYIKLYQCHGRTTFAAMTPRDGNYWNLNYDWAKYKTVVKRMSDNILDLLIKLINLLQRAISFVYYSAVPSDTASLF